jgi:hypothetical protein
VLTVPKGETQYAREIRKRAQGRRKNGILIIQNALKDWFRRHPNATKQERQKIVSQIQPYIDYLIGKAERNRQDAKLSKWDWRERIPVGPVMHQGEGCNTCWAFATSDAAAASILKGWQDKMNETGYSMMDDDQPVAVGGPLTSPQPANLRPSVQELINCMEIKAEDACGENWHGRVFELFVAGDGAPLVMTDDGTEKIAPLRTTNENNEPIRWVKENYKPGKKDVCKPNSGFRQFYSWDMLTIRPTDFRPFRS